MISVFLSPYSQTPGEKPYQTEHKKGRKLLTFGIKALYGLDILPVIGYDIHGKPYFPHREDIHFNISHCEGLVVCAISDAPVGVDVERIAPVSDNLPKRVLSEEELDQLSRLPKESPEYLEKFYRFWTLKESAVKQSGKGLSQELRDISFRLDEDREIRCSQPNLHFLQKKLVGNYILSLCSSQPIRGDEIGEYRLEE